MNITGIIKAIGSTQQVSDTFRKRTFNVEIPDPKYPQLLQFELTNDRVSLIDPPRRVGDEIKIEFEIRGREWKSPDGNVKHFTTLNAWKIETIKAASTPIAADEDVPF